MNRRWPLVGLRYARRSPRNRSPLWWSLLGLVMGLWVTPSLAAENIILKYGPLRRSLPVADLRLLADTGETTPELRTYLTLARQDPEKMQAGLTDSLEISVVELDRILNSIPGNLLLDEVGEIIHPPRGLASKQALRSALILDASEDQEITLIDTLENYPTADVELEGRKLVKVVKRVNRYRGYARKAEPAIRILRNEGRPLWDLVTGTLEKVFK